MIELVLISDDSYAMPTCIAINSIKKNRDRKEKHLIHVISDQMSEPSIKKIQMLGEDNFIIEVISVDIGDLEKIGGSNVPKAIHVSRAALIKFLLPELFINREKILYLDGDVVVQKSLKKLYETNIENVYLAAVADIKPQIQYQPSQNQKLGLNKEYYFNTGVMLMNLKKMREDSITSALIDYRTNGINYFMDQDAFNVVCNDKVEYIGLHNNAMCSSLAFFDYSTIKDYYGIKERGLNNFINNSTIIHYSSKEKPWIYSDILFSEMWDLYYYESPYKNENLKRKTSSKEKYNREEYEKIERDLNNLKSSLSYKIGRSITFIPRLAVGRYNNYRNNLVKYPTDAINKDERTPRIIVSLTTYPKRIGIVHLVINSLMKQTVKPDRIILYLSINQFPDKKIPRRLSKAQKYGLTIKYVEGDLKSHKKYYYAIQEYPDDLIITVDDDIIYNPKLIERLYKSYKKHPNCVSACRVHEITFNGRGEINPYNKWKKNYNTLLGRESFKLVATGVGGILYPPYSLNSIAFNSDLITNNCLMCDDLWLKIMEIMNGTKVVLASQENNNKLIEGSQKDALWKENVDGGQNDQQLKSIMNLNEVNSELIETIIRNDVEIQFAKCDSYNPVIENSISGKYIENLNQLLKVLSINTDDLIIGIIAKDTAEKYWNMMESNAITNKLRPPKYRNAYSAIIDLKEKFVNEQTNKMFCETDYKTNDLTIKAISYGFELNNLSYFQLSKFGRTTIYCFDNNTMNRGLHFLIYSKKRQKIVDFLRVDIHKDKELKIYRNSYQYR